MRLLNLRCPDIHPSESSARWDVSVLFAEVGDHASKRGVINGWGR